jgi:uncharacterized protein
MSVFREHKSIADRSAGDRKRHKKLVDRAIKDSIEDVIADESIIGQSGNKKIKIPIKGIKEYRFIYGDNENNKKVASGGEHDVQPGDQVGKKKQRPGDEAGNEAGEERYEIEVTLEELAEYLFAELSLPPMERKRFKFVKDKSLKRKGFRKQGIRPRLSKKETLKRKIRRKGAATRAGTYDPDSGERFPFHEDDLRYHHLKTTTKESSSAVVFFLMDVSGSMGTRKKFLARSLFFLLYQFINHKYDNVEVVFISHTTEAREATEKEFFERAESGGTKMSSATKLEEEIINKRYHPSSWNIYTFYCGDGENWLQDNPETIESLQRLIPLNQMVCYFEIIPVQVDYRHQLIFGGDLERRDGLWSDLGELIGSIFHRGRIKDKSDIWLLFRRLFGRESR